MRAISLFDWMPPAPVPEAWKPRALGHSAWPPNYMGVYSFRMAELAKMRADPAYLASAKAYYRKRPGEFIQHWMDTFNPRKKSARWMPFVFFERQQEFIDYLMQLIHDEEGGLVEKCRDIGATWLACAFSVHQWLFEPDTSVGWGSRKEQLVDKIGDMDSIFEKMRKLIEHLPDVFLPAGFNPATHATFMRIINPVNGSTITGEAGDNIGRGGRKSFYFKDESAHYSRPELIEAALGDNTNVQIDISSVNGLGNVFHRRREAGQEWAPNAELEKGRTRVFVFDWRHHPEKTDEWYNARKAKWSAEGMEHIFAQEVDRDYAGSQTGTIISLEWVRAAFDAHKLLAHWATPWDSGGTMAALDVADEGGDTNAFGKRKGVVLRHMEEWGSRDPGVTARRAIGLCMDTPGIECMYDSVGIGSNVKSEWNRLTKDLDPHTGKPILKPGLVNFVPWSAGAGVKDPFFRVIEDDDQSPMNVDQYGNLKAQAWWNLRARFYRTWQAVTSYKASLTDPTVTPIVFDPSDLISFDVQALGMAVLTKLEKELTQVTSDKNGAMKQIIDKKPDGMKSPNLADCVVMCYFPVDDGSSEGAFGTYADT